MTRATLSLLLLLGAACGDRARLWDAPLAVQGPLKAGGQAFWVDSTRGTVFALSPGSAGAPATVAMRKVPRNASFVAPSPSGDLLLVLSAGKEAVYKDQASEEPGLTVLRPVASAAPEVVRFYPLGRGLDRLAISADGTRALAYTSGASGQAGVFRNPNEIALVDLGQPAGSENPLPRTVRSFGSAPIGVVFSPPMPIPAPGGPARTLAVVLAAGYLTFLDLDHPARREITVPLVKPESASSVIPKQLFFSPQTGTVFVRADGASDLYSLTLTPRTAQGGNENDFVPSINQPSSGKTPLDMALFSDAKRDMILTANASGDLALIDAATSQFSILPLGEPVDTLLLTPASSPTLALAYSRKQPAPRIHFVELKGLAEGLTKNLTTRKLDQAVHQLVATPDGKQALVVHNDARTVVSILDLAGEHHTVSPIQGQLPLGSFDFASGSAGTFLVGVSAGLSRLGLLDLANLHAADLRLDGPPARVVALGDRIIVDHGAAEGMVTVVPRAGATRDECQVLFGFLLSGLLDGLED